MAKTKHLKNLQTYDDVRDLAIAIVDSMVKEGLIRDCMDSDCDDEFTAQDIIVEELCKRLDIDNMD